MEVWTLGSNTLSAWLEKSHAVEVECKDWSKISPTLSLTPLRWLDWTICASDDEEEKIGDVTCPDNGTDDVWEQGWAKKQWTKWEWNKAVVVPYDEKTLILEKL